MFVYNRMILYEDNVERPYQNRLESLTDFGMVIFMSISNNMYVQDAE